MRTQNLDGKPTVAQEMLLANFAASALVILATRESVWRGEYNELAYQAYLMAKSMLFHHKMAPLSLEEVKS